ncbi:MAG TPA: hypothetical protein VND40_00115 [Nitrososphaerales archaeon]|nr:hypothetical protein [Nitrososphaerales archaeon]
MTNRRAVSQVGVAMAFSVALALGIWAALGEAGIASQGLGAARGLVMTAVGVFGVTMAAWSRIGSKNDNDL